MIETSGVALPAAVAQAVGLVPSLRLDATVVVCDAETVRARIADRYVGDTVAAQLAQADLIVLNKLDLVAAQMRPVLQAWLSGLCPGADLVAAVRAAAPVDLLLGWPDAQPGTFGHSGLFAVGSDAGSWRSRHAAGTAGAFVSASLAIKEPIDVRRLAQGLTDRGLGLLRAKGVMHDSSGSVMVLQLVGSRVDVHDWHQAGREPPAAVLVCVGLRHSLDRDAIAKLLDSARLKAVTPAAPCGADQALRRAGGTVVKASSPVAASMPPSARRRCRCSTRPPSTSSPARACWAFRCGRLLNWSSAS